ncbi:hypothetical protein TRVA0_024S01728 [Trichomonascus vanleenenianus]|uniref:uncharacterized protein n=1 Tax=Trichomonascus vanleenenianus TaxID=2268995 RepID=UPI003ECA3619
MGEHRISLPSPSSAYQSPSVSPEVYKAAQDYFEQQYNDGMSDQEDFTTTPKTRNNSTYSTNSGHHSNVSLVMQDYQTDTSNHLPCGCLQGACVGNAYWYNGTKHKGDEYYRTH